MIIEKDRTALQPELHKFIAAHLAEFKPFAYYDKHLDCIRVQIRDCSVLEERKNRIFTVLRANHAKSGTLVGFNIKGVRHLFEQLGLDRQTCYQVADLMNLIVRLYPEESTKRIADEFSDVLTKEGLQITVDADPVAA